MSDYRFLEIDELDLSLLSVGDRNTLKLSSAPVKFCSLVEPTVDCRLCSYGFAPSYDVGCIRYLGWSHSLLGLPSRDHFHLLWKSEFLFLYPYLHQWGSYLYTGLPRV